MGVCCMLWKDCAKQPGNKERGNPPAPAPPPANGNMGVSNSCPALQTAEHFHLIKVIQHTEKGG